jgi:hypothetical protein
MTISQTLRYPGWAYRHNITEQIRYPQWASLQNITDWQPFFERKSLSLSQSLELLESYSTIESYCLSKNIDFVYTSNLLEQTLPDDCSDDLIYKALELAWAEESIINPCSISTSWPIEGNGNHSQMKAQMLQHTRACKYLWGIKLLSVDSIVRTYEILAAGSFKTDDGTLVDASLRTCSVHEGVYTYPDASTIPDTLFSIIAAFNTSDSGYVYRTAKLYYDFLTLHPFVYGNGRMARMLVAFSLLKSGAPFAISIKSGHSRERKVCMRAILDARMGRGVGQLSSLIASSLFIETKKK